ncbi:IS110 family transposase, partial [Salipaludibacillus neizhouensis]
MNPVIGLDVSKGESEVQAFLDNRKPYKKSFSVLHNNNGLENLLRFLIEVEGETGVRPTVIFEST